MQSSSTNVPRQLLIGSRPERVKARWLGSVRWPFVLGLAFVLATQGCSLFVMGGRMLLGDTKSPSQFKQATHKDLAKLNRRVLVVCTASDTVRALFPAVEFDILEGVTHRLKANGIKKLVSSDTVAGWLDEQGARLDDPTELAGLAKHFHADYVIHIEILKFTCNEENSPDLLRGNSEGHVHAYEFDQDKKRMLEIMLSDFSSVYPKGNPISVDKKSVKNFEQEYLERITLQLSQIFYDHPRAEEME
jgi:hypothetical protein